jgi:hypothetical protein
VPNDRLLTRTILRAPIHFAAEGGRPVHAPLVLATIGAFHTRLILDTGSDVHLLTAGLAAAAGLPLAALDTGTDHANRTMDSWLVGEVPIALDEADGEPELKLRDVVAIPAPEAFTRQGIGGALSPQRLHASAFAVIDEVADELHLVEGDPRAIREWLLEQRPRLEVLTLERRAGAAIPIVDAAIRPFPAVPTLVNTGGRHTEFEPEAVPGLAAAAVERIGTGVSGAAVMAGRAGRHVLDVAGRSLDVRDLMLREGMGDPPAMIGQDLLRGTVVAVGPNPSTPVFWQVGAV